MVATNARPVPRRATPYRITFPIYDATGDLIVNAVGLDSEISKDGAAFVDCTNEATEIGSSGVYYLDLTATEMDADTVAVIVKSGNPNARPLPFVLNPEEVGDFRVGGYAGAIAKVWTEYQTDGVTPLPGVDVWVTSNPTGVPVLASGITDASGQVTFMLDPGTYYVWRHKPGWAPTLNPIVVMVA